MGNVSNRKDLVTVGDGILHKKVFMQSSSVFRFNSFEAYAMELSGGRPYIVTSSTIENPYRGIVKTEVLVFSDLVPYYLYFLRSICAGRSFDSERLNRVLLYGLN
jgi:hypothetical protein